MKRLKAVVAVMALVACDRSQQAAMGADVLNELTSSTSTSAWQGLLKPATLHVAEDGSVYIADNGDARIRVFDDQGTPRLDFGGFGSGPGEFGVIRDFTLSNESVNVFDATGTRFLRLSRSGEYMAAVETSGLGDESIASLGNDRIIVASSARWSMPASAGEGDWPLARVMDLQGTTVLDIGERTPVANPFASHVLNFVLPAGSRDGRFVWLAFLNSPDVVLYSVAGGTMRRISRELPFRWQRIPENFVPSSERPEPGKPFIPPFDAITYDVDVDQSGRAYVLTALESSRAASNEPRVMGIDVLSPDSSTAPRRYRVDGYYTHIAVSPDAKRIYLLDSSRGVLRQFQGPQ